MTPRKGLRKGQNLTPSFPLKAQWQGLQKGSRMTPRKGRVEGSNLPIIDLAGQKLPIIDRFCRILPPREVKNPIFGWPTPDRGGFESSL